MTAQRHLVLFVKAPRLGAVKTRLAKDVGAMAAWRFYRATMARMIRRLGRDERWRCWLFVTPDRFARRARFWPAHLSRRPQGGGDLGARMGRAFDILPRGPVVIIGGDIPEIKASDIARAFRALDRRHVVFGPASDGGYWLIGARRRSHLWRLFRNVRWSSRHALADTAANLDRRHEPAMLKTYDDIDDGADYERWRLRASL